MITNYKSLYDFTKIRVKTARHRARAGDKDAARVELYWLKNARILEILKGIDWPDYLKVDVALLGWEIGQLESECHPLDHTPNPEPYDEMRAKIDLIAGWVAKEIQRQKDSPAAS